MFIDKTLRETGVSPSFDEMKDALGLASKSGIHRLIMGLEERGFLRRLAHRARALEVTKMPENRDGQTPPRNVKFTPSVVKAEFAPPPPPPSPFQGAKVDRHAEGMEAVQIPLHGKIAAGTPIEALQDNSNHVGVPVDMIGRGEHYALVIEGDSMIDAGILDGDTVVIRRCDSADTGDIVVALVEEHEATLKRLR
ncbi:MAG: repressor LexA, partial [Alphaproteobacteria bacterium RIFOXYD12_FULL_60_8]